MSPVVSVHPAREATTEHERLIRFLIRFQSRVSGRGCAYYLKNEKMGHLAVVDRGESFPASRCPQRVRLLYTIRSTLDGSREPNGVGILMEHILFFFVNGAYASLQ